MDKVTVVGPDGLAREAPVRDGHAQIFGTRAGFYELYPVSASCGTGERPRRPATFAASQAARRRRDPGAKAGGRARATAKEPMLVVAATFKTRPSPTSMPEGALAAGKKAAEITKAELVERILGLAALRGAPRSRSSSG